MFVERDAQRSEHCVSMSCAYAKDDRVTAIPTLPRRAFFHERQTPDRK
jgi:hypothetical protein